MQAKLSMQYLAVEKSPVKQLVQGYQPNAPAEMGREVNGGTLESELSDGSKNKAAKLVKNCPCKNHIRKIIV